MMNLKKVLMLFLLGVMLWFSLIIFPQTYADLIDNIGVDNIQDEVNIDYETDELDNADESDIYDDAELEHESYQDLEFNDDSFDEEDYLEDINNNDIRTITFRLDRRFAAPNDVPTYFDFSGGWFEGLDTNTATLQVRDGQSLANSSFDNTMPIAVRPGYNFDFEEGRRWRVYESPEEVSFP